MDDNVVSDALTVEQVQDETSKARLAWSRSVSDKLDSVDKLSIAIITGHLLGIRYAHSRGQKLLAETIKAKGKKDGDNI